MGARTRARACRKLAFASTLAALCARNDLTVTLDGERASGLRAVRCDADRFTLQLLRQRRQRASRAEAEGKSGGARARNAQLVEAAGGATAPRAQVRRSLAATRHAFRVFAPAKKFKLQRAAIGGEQRVFALAAWCRAQKSRLCIRAEF